MCRIRICAAVLAVTVVFGLLAAQGMETAGMTAPGTAATAKAVAAPLRIGYCQSDPYYEYDTQLYYLVKGMAEFGLIPDLPDSSGIGKNSSSRTVWDYISSRDQTGWRVEFVPEVFLSLDTPGNIEKLIKENQVQLMITMGTQSGLTVKSLGGKTPQMNFMAADSVNAGITEGIFTSDTEGVWAQNDPGYMARTMSVMEDTFHPKKIGIVYADHPDAYIYSGAREVDRFSRSRGIKVSREYVDDVFEDLDRQAYIEGLHAAHTALAPSIDVFILTTSLMEPEDYPYVLQPFYAAGVPVYSVNSVTDVEYGAMMAVEISDYENIGRLGADTLKQYIEGSRLEDLNQVYQTAPFLVLNYTAAKKTGYKPDFSMLLSSSRIYH